MSLSFEYGFVIDFDAEVNNQTFCIMATPRAEHNIKHLCIAPQGLFQTKDGFGNTLLFGTIAKKHRKFAFSLRGSVENLPIDTDDSLCALFLTSTPLTAFCVSKHEYQMKLKISSMNTQQKAAYVCSYIHDTFEYKRGFTDSQSTVADLLTTRKGVCQDFAHLAAMILRHEHIPTRYASGLCYGEGESHAWVECFIDGRWVCVDPTNNRIDDTSEYIKFAHGRDYADCTPNRGVFNGFASQTLSVYAKVEKEHQ